jgi:hypothetical protein
MHWLAVSTIMGKVFFGVSSMWLEASDISWLMLLAFALIIIPIFPVVGDHPKPNLGVEHDLRTPSSVHFRGTITRRSAVCCPRNIDLRNQYCDLDVTDERIARSRLIAARLAGRCQLRFVR